MLMVNLACIVELYNVYIGSVSQFFNTCITFPEKKKNYINTYCSK